MSNRLCSDCGHTSQEHGKQIPERPPHGCHIKVCASLVNMDGTPSNQPCNCGANSPQPAYYDPGCFGPNFCGCIEFIEGDSNADKFLRLY